MDKEIKNHDEIKDVQGGVYHKRQIEEEKGHHIALESEEEKSDFSDPIIIGGSVL